MNKSPRFSKKEPVLENLELILAHIVSDFYQTMFAKKLPVGKFMKCLFLSIPFWKQFLS